MGKADAILKAAFRGPLSRRHELGLYRRIQPDGWFLASRRGDPVGMVGAVVYDAFAHVGMMAVHPAAQRQGVGMALMRFLLSRLDRGGVPLVSLDASEAGRPMYEKLGFVAHGETLTFQRREAAGGRAPAADIPRISRGELPEVAAWDARCFGAGREKVLRILWADAPDRALLLRRGGPYRRLSLCPAGRDRAVGVPARRCSRTTHQGRADAAVCGGRFGDHPGGKPGRRGSHPAARLHAYASQPPHEPGGRRGGGAAAEDLRAGQPRAGLTTGEAAGIIRARTAPGGREGGRRRAGRSEEGRQR